jgi:DNA-binding transcriptional LysR family regulator
MVVFEALMNEGSVTAASERLGMTQPAVSNALSRLRYLLNDRLFIRGGIGIVPTSRALEIAGPLRDALRLIEASVAPQVFDPLTSRHTFQLALSDAAVLALLPPLMQRLSRDAPGIVIQTQPKALPSLPNLLDKNQIDMAIGLFPRVPPRFESHVLFNDHYVCLMRRNHPLADAELDLDALARTDHVSLRAVPSATAQIDEFMAAKGLGRRIMVTTNQVAAIPRILEDTDLVACILESTARAIAEILPDKIVKRQVDVGSVEIRLVWHTDLMSTMAGNWLRKEIIQVAEQMPRDAFG